MHVRCGIHYVVCLSVCVCVGAFCLFASAIVVVDDYGVVDDVRICGNVVDCSDIVL